MLKTEIYRIFSRKTTWAAMLAAILTVIYYSLGNTIWGEGVIDNGGIYRGKEAVVRDREIAAAFTGPLTEKTVRQLRKPFHHIGGHDRGRGRRGK